MKDKDGWLLSRIAALPTMSINDLRRMWREFCESEPPKFNRIYLEQRLTYRLQELVYGGLSKKTIAELRRLRGSQSPSPKRRTVNLATGVVLIKEYQDAEHRVEVLRDGFVYDGKTYKSLSAIARKITGNRWNGPKFFGLPDTR